jgi:hypothetical protein
MIGLHRHGDAEIEEATLYAPANANSGVYGEASATFAGDESSASWLQVLGGSGAHSSARAFKQLGSVLLMHISTVCYTCVLWLCTTLQLHGVLLLSFNTHAAQH